MSEQNTAVTINVERTLQQALSYKAKGDLERAIAIYQQLIGSEPNNPLFYDRLAQIQAQKGIVSIAIENYQKALDLGIKNPFWTHKNLGDALRDSGELTSAIYHYQKAISIDGENPQVYDALGQVQALNGEYGKAISNYQKAIALGVSNPIWIYQNLQNALLAENRVEEATLIRQKLQNLAPDSERKNLEPSIAPVKSDNSWLQIHHRGDLEFSQNQWQEAVKLYLQAIELNPHYFWSHYNLGRAYSQLKQPERSIESYQQAIRAETGKSHYIYLSLGAIFKEQNELEKTVAIYNQAIEICSEAEKPFFIKELNLLLPLVKTQQSSSKVPIVEPKDRESKATERLFPKLSDEAYISYLYETFLKRKVDPQGLESNLQALKENVPRRIILENLLKTKEFLSRNKISLLKDMSDCQFLHLFWQLLLGRTCNPAAEEIYLKHLASGVTRTQVLADVTESDEFKNRIEALELLSEERLQETGSVWIMGTDKHLTQAEWERKLLKVLHQQLKSNNHGIHSPRLPSDYANSKHIQKYLALKKKPLISIITSLYKGAEYIESFLENITSQTIFNLCELIIIDANSPEGEFETIGAYQEKFANIKYFRTEKTIGIYAAWNIGVAKSQGEFLTNANLDDLRRFDCLEKQALALLEHREFDVVYQDFFYSLTSNLPFEIIEQCGFQSQLPEVTKETMLQYNPPHNAPMWRKSLHDKIGLFNTGYKSAGDYEFWMRAFLQDSRFLKIDESLVVYYNNPRGISTRKESNALLEAKEIQVVYNHLLADNFFSLSKTEFIDIFTNYLEQSDGSPSDVETACSEQQELITLDTCFVERLNKLSSDKFYFPLQECEFFNY